MRHRGRGASLAAAVASIALLTACTADPSSTSTSTSSTSTPSATASSATPTPVTTEVAPGTLDQNALAAQIVTTLQTSLGEGPTIEAQCPPSVPLAMGGTSACTAYVDGQELGYTVTQKDAAGNVDFAADEAVLDMAELTATTAQQFGTQVGGTWTATCPPADIRYRVLDVGSIIECMFASDGQQRPFVVTVKDADGSIEWAEA